MQLPAAISARRRTRTPFAADQQQVARVNEYPEHLAGDEDRVPPIHRIGEERHAARQAEVPKGDRNYASLVALALDPLPKKPHHKQELSDEPDRNPHHFTRAERVEIRSRGIEEALHFELVLGTVAAGRSHAAQASLTGGRYRIQEKVELFAGRVVDAADTVEFAGFDLGRFH